MRLMNLDVERKFKLASERSGNSAEWQEPPGVDHRRAVNSTLDGTFQYNPG